MKQWDRGHGMLVSAREMRGLEESAVAAGISAEALMEEAGAGLAEVVRQTGVRRGLAVVFAGKGHNAGDAFVLARHLLRDGWEVEVRAVWDEESWRPLTRRKLAEVRGDVCCVPLESVIPDRVALIIDGLVGIGFSGEVVGRLRLACLAVRAMRESTGAMVLAVDVPSGLPADGGDADSAVVVADVTVALGYAKLGHCADGAAAWCGRLAVVPLTGLPAPAAVESGRPRLLTPELLRGWLGGPRNFAMHKGEAGRVGVLAGSVGLTGAARLAAAGASQAGAGLVTLFTPASVWSELASGCPPEVMVRPVRSCRELMEATLDALAVGPGLGTAAPADLLTLIRRDGRPMLVDADGLNALAALPGGHEIWPAAGPRLLTPHPGEMERLLRRFAPGLLGASVAAQAGGLAQATGATVLRKGSRSCVASPDGRLAYNASGHPAMARGGMGDVLSGMAAAFLAGGLEPFAAACLASWLIGAGAESWLRRNGWAVEALSASAVLRHACRKALPALRNGGIF